MFNDLEVAKQILYVSADCDMIVAHKIFKSKA